jgi:tape measure domain-containing protein
MTAPGIVGRSYIEILPEMAKYKSTLKQGIEQQNKVAQQQLKQLPQATRVAMGGVERESRSAFGRMAGFASGFAGGVITTLGRLSIYGGAALGGLAIAAVASGLKTAAGMEQAQIAFAQLLGSSTKAKAYLADLAKFAAATPYELPGLIDASRQLIGAGLNATQAKTALVNFGDATSALGITQDGFNRIMLATSQALSSGTLHAGDLLQMTEAGLPVWKLLGEALGLPVSKVRELSEQGKLMTADVLPKLEAQMHKDYGGAMAKQSQTLAGLWSTLMDTLHMGMANALVPMEPMLRTLIPRAAGVMTGAFKTLGAGMSNFFNGLTGKVKIMAQSDRPKLELFGLGLRALVLAFKDGTTNSHGFVGAMETIGVTAHNVWDKIYAAMKSTFDWIKVQGPIVWGGLLDVITAIWDVLYPALYNAWEKLHGILQTVGSYIIATLGPVMHGLATFIDDQRAALTLLVEGMLAYYAAAKLIALTIAIWKGIAAAITAVRVAVFILELTIAPVAGIVALIVAAVALLALGFYEAYKHITPFREAINAVGKALVWFFTTTFEFVKRWGVEILAVIFPVLGIPLLIWKYWSQITGFVTKAWDGVWSFLKSIPGRVLNAFAAAGTWLLDAGKKIMVGLWKGLVAGVPALITFYVLLPFRILGWIFRIDRFFVLLGVRMIMDMWRGLVVAVPAIARWFVALPGRIVSWLWQSAQWAVRMGMRIIGEIVSGLVQAVPAVARWFAALPGRVVSWLWSSALWAVRMGMRIVGDIIGGLGRSGPGIGNWFRHVPGWISHAIWNVAKWAIGIGGRMIGDLVKGLGNAIGSVVTWFKNLPGKILSALGITSPPKWAISAGEWIIKGFLKGAGASGKHLVKFFGALAHKAWEGIQGAAGAGMDVFRMGGTLQGVTGYGDLNAWIARAIAATGAPANWAPALWRRAWFESSGNPNAINLTDSNALAGHPSQGLMQTIPNTFAHYHQPGTSWNILDPVANLAAAINYIRARYGTIWNIDPPVSGYAAGAWNVPSNQLAFLHAKEMVIPAPAAEKLRRGEQTSGGSIDYERLGQAVAAAIAGMEFRVDADGLVRIVNRARSIAAVKGVRR